MGIKWVNSELPETTHQPAHCLNVIAWVPGHIQHYNTIGSHKINPKTTSPVGSKCNNQSNMADQLYKTYF